MSDDTRCPSCNEIINPSDLDEMITDGRHERGEGKCPNCGAELDVERVTVYVIAKR